MFKTIGLIAKQGDPRVHETLLLLRTYLEARGISTLLEENCAADCRQLELPLVDTESLGQRCDLIIVVGGDGTLLKAARSLVEYDIRLLGVNLGRLGYLADISPDDMTECLEPILNGHYCEEERFLLEARAYRGDHCLCRSRALNDVVVHKWHTAHLFAYTTLINERLVSSQRADGLLVSTPTGSTAYALSGGGPLLHPTLDTLLIVSICPHALSNRPIVVDGDSEVEIILAPNQEAQAQMTCDGIPCQTLLPGDRVMVKKDKYVKLLHPLGHDHYATWRAKLHWGREV